MTGEVWRLGPYGLNMHMAATFRAERTVLVVVHHVAAATRLAEAVGLLETDRRIQIIYTVSPASVLSDGVAEQLRQTGVVLISFDQATQIRFDLALAAGDGLLERIHAPVLTLPHGVGPSVLINRWQGMGAASRRPVAGLRPETLVSGGRIIPRAITVAHTDHAAMLADSCPELRASTVVTGDLTLDNLMASRTRREDYRRALGVPEDAQLVAVSSTWGPRSLLGTQPDLLPRLALALAPSRYRIVAILHPNIWHWHGRKQLAAWYADCRKLGVGLVDPLCGWQAALIAADRLVGDHGSVTCYATALGVPTLLAAFPDNDIVPGSDIALLGEAAPRLVADRPLAEQVAASEPSSLLGSLLSRLSSRPGEAGVELRRLMYELMDLPEPLGKITPGTVPLPRLVEASP